ncbi:hypothetical protein B0H21DRAFT_139904 [Amylocystis lapponica]|nr:hypothetical protein B0H21DRAFT_139904 [Amylocystis lapponica]
MASPKSDCGDSPDVSQDTQALLHKEAEDWELFAHRIYPYPPNLPLHPRPQFQPPSAVVLPAPPATINPPKKCTALQFHPSAYALERVFECNPFPTEKEARSYAVWFGTSYDEIQRWYLEKRLVLRRQLRGDSACNGKPDTAPPRLVTAVWGPPPPCIKRHASLDALEEYEGD